MTPRKSAGKRTGDEVRDGVAWPRGVGQPAIRALTEAGHPSFVSLAGASRLALLSLHGVGPKALGIIDAELRVRDLEGLAP